MADHAYSELRPQACKIKWNTNAKTWPGGEDVYLAIRSSELDPEFTKHSWDLCSTPTEHISEFDTWILEIEILWSRWIHLKILILNFEKSMLTLENVKFAIWYIDFYIYRYNWLWLTFVNLVKHCKTVSNLAKPCKALNNHVKPRMWKPCETMRKPGETLWNLVGQYENHMKH